MKIFTKILVPVDFSSHANEAVRYAADLSRTYGATVMIVHVAQPPSYMLPDLYYPFTPNQVIEINAMNNKGLEAALQQARTAGAQGVASKLLQGYPAAEIAACAALEKFDLIVMGSHGRTGISHALLGSIAEKVTRQAPCPVLIVRLAAAV